MAEYEQLAEVVDECIHGITTAWCSICKQQTKDKEARRRRTREQNHPAWEVDEDTSLPYPHTTASWPGTCTSCDTDYEAGTEIWKADGGWCCHQCAVDYATLGVGTDGG